MDLDSISQQKILDGPITPQAIEARKALGRCFRFNRSGHMATNCPLGLPGELKSLEVNERKFRRI